MVEDIFHLNAVTTHDHHNQVQMVLIYFKETLKCVDQSD